MGGEQQLPRRRRVRRYAAVREDAAYAIAVKFGSQIRELAQRVGRFDAAFGLALLEGLEQLDGIGRAWHEDGRAEEAAVAVPSRGELSRREVADRLGVCERQVTNLIRDQKLDARKPRGQWLIEEGSVLRYQRRRDEMRSA